MSAHIALVGRPNVGKSTLFNALTRSKDAVVADSAGTTRDIHYGIVRRYTEKPFVIIDTGGIAADGTTDVDTHITQHIDTVLTVADAIFFVVDTQAGLHPYDYAVADILRRAHTTAHVYLIANKIDGLDERSAWAELCALGFSTPYTVSAKTQRGLKQLMHDVDRTCGISHKTKEQTDGIRVAVIGRPNVGKSTCINRLIGKAHLFTSPVPGATRDSISIPWQSGDTTFVLTDTAGMRKRARVTDGLEKDIVLRAIRALSTADVAVVVFDAHVGISEQDITLLGLAAQYGKGIVLLLNKSDSISHDDKQALLRELTRRLSFASWLVPQFVSAKRGTGMRHVPKTIRRVYDALVCDLPTPEVTDVLHDAVRAHPPPIHRGRRIKLRYAHQGGKNPPIIVVHGSQTAHVPLHYTRFLTNTFRDHFRLFGVPLAVTYKSGTNPYADKKNTLTDRQIRKRKRLMRFVKR